MTETEPVLTNLKMNVKRNLNNELDKTKKATNCNNNNTTSTSNTSSVTLECCQLDWLQYERDMNNRENRHIFYTTCTSNTNNTNKNNITTDNSDTDTDGNDENDSQHPTGTAATSGSKNNAPPKRQKRNNTTTIDDNTSPPPQQQPQEEHQSTRKYYDTILGTDVLFAPHLVEPLLKTMHALSHAHTKIYLCLQIRCPTSHQKLLDMCSSENNNNNRLFDLEDITNELMELPSCKWGIELECYLFRLTPRQQERIKNKQEKSVEEMKK